MTVSTSTNKSGPYAGAGSTGPFTVGFRFLAASHLQVIRTSVAGDDTTLTLTTDYSVSGVGAATGSVTLVVALAVGEKLTIIRNVPFTQDADYVANDSFPAESHEDALDKLVMMAQQLKERIDAALTLAASSSGVSARLPPPVGGKLLGWAADGLSIENLDASGVGAGSVGTTQLADGGVTAAKLAAGAAASNIGYTPANDALVAHLAGAETLTGAKRGTQTTDNDLSFDLNATNNFKCTLAAGGTLTFTNIASAAGQSGHIVLVNGSNYTVAKAATVKCGSSVLTTISATGSYLLAYYCDGTDVWVTASGALS